MPSNKSVSEVADDPMKIDEFSINLFKKCYSLRHIPSNFANFSDFRNTGTFTFSFIVSELSMMKTSVSPFWEENKLRCPLKLKN